ncbi:hypothetical protein B9G54_06415, partial [Alloscardovia macacae]
MKSTKIQGKVAAILLGVLAMMAAVVGMMPSLLQVSSAAEATGVAVANSITGSVTGNASYRSITGQSLSVTTTLTQDAHAGDYVEYSFKNVATTKLNGMKLVNASGEQIGELKIAPGNERLPEVNKQSSQNVNLQSGMQLGTGWLAEPKAVFSTDVPSGTSFTFSSTGVAQPVIYAAREYTLDASVTSTNGTGSVSTVFTIPAYPVETSPTARLNGIFTFTGATDITSEDHVTLAPQKDLQVGDEITIKLTDASGVRFNPESMGKSPIVLSESRPVGGATAVNAQGAYIVPSKLNVELTVVEATPESVTVRVTKGSIPKLYRTDAIIGNNGIALTRNNFRPANNAFDIFSAEVTVAGERLPGVSAYSVRSGDKADLSSLDITEFYDEAGTEIQPSVYSNTNPSRDIAGYHLMRETAASPNAGTRLIYHRMMTRFVDDTKKDIPGADPVVGTDAPQKEIDGYLYADKETADNGDVLYVYHKLEEREETKEITRTITYLDATTKGSAHAPEVQKVTLTRTNTRDTVTNTVVEEGVWSEASWPEVKSPFVENYKAPSVSSVPEVRVTGATTDTAVEVTYEQDTEDVPESKTVTRTIHYVDATSGETVAPDEAQPATISRTNVRNKVTNDVTEGAWSEASWAAVKSPDVKNYVNPDTPTVEAVSITPETQNAEVTVRYQQGTEDVPDSKTVTRTIHYVDATSGETVAPDK